MRDHFKTKRLRWLFIPALRKQTLMPRKKTGKPAAASQLRNTSFEPADSKPEAMKQPADSNNTKIIAVAAAVLLIAIALLYYRTQPGQSMPAYAAASASPQALGALAIAPPVPSQPAYGPPAKSPSPAAPAASASPAIASPGGMQAASTVQVEINDFYYKPDNVSIRAGDTVVWTNNGGVLHTVTTDDHTLNSPQMSHGMSYNHTFAVAGAWKYYDSLHPGYFGLVYVN